DLHPGNLPLLAGRRFIHGYSPLRNAGLTGLFGCAPHGFCDPDDARRILRQETGPDGELALLGVDGLLVSHHLAEYLDGPLAHGWEVTDRRTSCVVLHRRGPPSPPPHA